MRSDGRQPKDSEKNSLGKNRFIEQSFFFPPSKTNDSEDFPSFFKVKGGFEEKIKDISLNDALLNPEEGGGGFSEIYFIRENF